ncbi:MAG TPA: hypothetical protein DCO83_05530 [Mucilaginibacter sp.]|jgi:hypothetical protein|nr:hypothetical protein [Mucilaginibacter sp.]
MSLKFIANSANQVSCHWLKADIMSAVSDFYVNSGTSSAAVAVAVAVLLFISSLVGWSKVT